MKYLNLYIAAFCTFAALWQFKATALDAFCLACAVVNFGMFLSQKETHDP